MKRYALREACVSAVVSAILSAAIFFLLFAPSVNVPAFGANGLVRDALGQTFGVVLMSTLVPALLARKRARTGTIPITATVFGWPIVQIVAGCVLAALAAALLSSGGQSVIFAYADVQTIGFQAALVGKTVFGFVIGGLAAWMTVLIALKDA